MKSAQKILEFHSSSTPSKWREDAERRRANRKWLKKAQQIAMAVLDIMESKQMNQKELAEKMDVTPQYVSKLLKGAQNLSLETVSKLEDILEAKILVVQTFSTNQRLEFSQNWNQPIFTVIMPAKERRQSYKPTMIYDGCGCSVA